MSDIHDPSASTSNTPEARPNDGSSSSTPSNRIEQNIAIDAVGTQPVTGYPPATQHQHLNHLSAIDFSNLDSLLSAANNNSIETSGLTPPFLPTSLDDLFVQMPNWLLNSNIGVDAPVTSQASIQPFDDSLQPAPSSQQNGVDVVFDQSNSLVSYQPASAWASSSNTAISKSDHPIDIIRQPDALAAYFPSPEQRHLFRHFVNETAPDLLVTPVPPSNNPWLTHFANLALGQASGTDVAHDAFRLALLSLASFDMGMKMDSTLRCKEENAMYALSEEHRTSAMNILEMGKIVGKAPVQVEGDSNSADLTLGVAIALGIRDRLAGTQDWEKPIALGTQVVLDHQGPAKYIAESPTKERRFLVEQMACIEMLGMMTIFYAPTILAWDNDWLFDVPSGGSSASDIWLGQTYAANMCQGDQSRQIEFLKSGNAEFNFPAVTAKIQEMDRALTDRGDRLLREVQSLRVEELSSRALRGIRTLLPCMEISLIAGDLCQADMNQEHIQSKVSAVLDTVEEAISQGMYAG
ncbi:hypothetical protein I316_06530 [Kwoniella heveanensis BCC8398]|uniref:Transcription factor domain-containing protein n=1 Tax=Kwoniella heveanensis BCC8398 TaxID=1296120 RepID=A0A1B9GL72_9TREE|nr:hypothetical protein I316_06530 [Kwoniella heveanensis BCC8398]